MWVSKMVPRHNQHMLRMHGKSHLRQKIQVHAERGGGSPLSLHGMYSLGRHNLHAASAACKSQDNTTCLHGHRTTVATVTRLRTLGDVVAQQFHVVACIGV